MLRTLSGVGALSLALMAGLASLYLAGGELGRGEDMSRDSSPSSLRPDGARGALVWARPLNTAAVLPSAARNYRVLYHSRSPDDSDVVAPRRGGDPVRRPPCRWLAADHVDTWYDWPRASVRAVQRYVGWARAQVSLHHPGDAGWFCKAWLRRRRD